MTIEGIHTTTWVHGESGKFSSYSPNDGTEIVTVSACSENQYNTLVSTSEDCFKRWRITPAPERGELIRRIGLRLRENKVELGRIITREVGKIPSEAEGEVQEAIDMADFAVGLSRQLYGLAMHSERPNHRMYEQWHPLGPIGVITAFNFPCAVWAWNAFVAAVCGNTVIWSPSELASQTAIEITKIASEEAKKFGFPGLFTLACSSGPEIGKLIAADKRIPLVSATGSCRMGKDVAAVVGKRLGRSLLELGGNNCIIVCEDADIELTVRGVAFGAVGTAGQRCTTTRRLLVHKNIKQDLLNKLAAAYKTVSIGNPENTDCLMGPLINQSAVDSYLNAVKEATKQGASLVCGGHSVEGLSSPYFVEPTIIDCPGVIPVMREETFAPILYVVEFESLADAIEIQNDVVQGLSSAIFTNNIRNSELFLSAAGSDCGIANVNIGTSGAEIGGAFGGEKETGGGRESGSDSWKAYMRRQTTTINYGTDLPLAQGVKFT